MNTQTQAPSVSFSEEIRQAFRTQKYVDVEAVAFQRIGKTPNDKERSAVLSIIYSIRKSIEKELKGKMVREGHVFRILPVVDQPSIASAIVSPKTKTAVLVVREVRDDKGARYELDVVGEFNRGMMKEALKQLMEVFI